jgi:RNase P/RNase MRP subunit POP5
MQTQHIRNKHETVELLVVQCSNSQNQVEDPRELTTILQFSIRSLFGDLESHSYAVQITKATEVGKFIVSCSRSSVKAVRSALTMVTPPPYLESNIYRFDVVSVTES